MFYSPFITDKLLCCVLITLQVHKVVELKRTYQITKSSSGKFYGLKQDESHEFATKLL
jgi:hypothetical protein